MIAVIFFVTQCLFFQPCTAHIKMSTKFKASCSASIFKQAIKCQLLPDVWKISPEGLSYQAHHRTGTPVMGELYLSTQEFKMFECKEEFLMGINPKYFRKIWNCTEWTDTIVMSVDEDVSHLDLVVHNQRGTLKKTQTFHMKCVPAVHLKAWVERKNEDYVCQLEMPSDRFRDISNGLRKISELKNDITIRMTADKVVFESLGDDPCMKSTVTVTPKDRDYKYTSSMTVEAPFRNIMVNFPTFNMFLNDKIWLKFTEDKLLVAEYRILKGGFKRYYMAPQTEMKHCKRKGGVPIKSEWKKSRYFE